MHQSTTKFLVAIFAVIPLTMSGCSSLMTIGVSDDYRGAKVLRMEAKSSEDPEHYTGPTNGGWIMNGSNWSQETTQYRFVYVNEVFGGILTGGVRHRGKAIIDSRVPTISEGDIIDVYSYDVGAPDLANFKVSTVIYLVCRARDTACKDREKKKYGELTGFVVEGPLPNPASFVFKKVYGLDGKALPN